MREREVVRGDRGGDVRAAFTRRTDQCHRARGRHVADVEVRAGQLRERDVARDHRRFAARGTPSKPEPGGDPALVHLSARDESGVLGVLRDGEAEPG